MAYKLLGMVMWKGAKWFLLLKYRAARSPKPLLTGGLLLALIVGASVAAARRPALRR